MKPWLKGGLFGLFIRLIYEIIQYILISHDFLNLEIFFLFLQPALAYFIIGSVIGYTIDKTRHFKTSGKNWKNWPSWLKGGIIGAFLGLFFIIISFHSLNLNLFRLFSFKIYPILINFLIGALIGFLVERYAFIRIQEPILSKPLKIEKQNFSNFFMNYIFPFLFVSFILFVIFLIINKSIGSAEEFFSIENLIRLYFKHFIIFIQDFIFKEQSEFTYVPVMIILSYIIAIAIILIIGYLILTWFFYLIRLINGFFKILFSREKQPLNINYT